LTQSGPRGVKVVSSNYGFPPMPEMVREEQQREQPCSRCKGLGTVEVHGQETDCIACEGWGSVLI
jgi:DnaJ-class molecular chaperone